MIPLPEPEQLQVVHMQYPCAVFVTGYSAAKLRAYGDAVRAEEREHLRAALMARHEAAKGQHNMYHCLAVELFDAPKEDNHATP